MTQQVRRRERALENAQLPPGRTFVSPSAGSEAGALVRQEELFDSNGFVHMREGAPRWNPAHRIYADYEYFLQCLGIWGAEAFTVLPQPLIEYVQRHDGVIGQSNYGQWAEELQELLARNATYPVLDESARRRLEQLARKYNERHARNEAIPAFA